MPAEQFLIVVCFGPTVCYKYTAIDNIPWYNIIYDTVDWHACDCYLIIAIEHTTHHGTAPLPVARACTVCPTSASYTIVSQARLFFQVEGGGGEESGNFSYPSGMQLTVS